MLLFHFARFFYANGACLIRQMEPALLHLVVFYKILIRTMPNANGRCHAAMHIFISLMRRDSRNNERNGISLEQTLQQLQDEHRKRLHSSLYRFLYLTSFVCNL